MGIDALRAGARASSSGLRTGLAGGRASTAPWSRWWPIPSFLVTLGMFGIARGGASGSPKSAPQPIAQRHLQLRSSDPASVGPVPTLVVWTPSGRDHRRTSCMNKTSLRPAGPGDRRQRASRRSSRASARGGSSSLVLAVCGTTAALAGMLYAGRCTRGRYQWGDGDELSAIAAVILGGTSLAGGRGSVIGAFLGAADDRAHQQRSDPRGPGGEPAGDHPWRDHHRRSGAGAPKVGRAAARCDRVSRPGPARRRSRRERDSLSLVLNLVRSGRVETRQGIQSVSGLGRAVVTDRVGDAHRAGPRGGRSLGCLDRRAGPHDRTTERHRGVRPRGVAGDHDPRRRAGGPVGEPARRASRAHRFDARGRAHPGPPQ